MPRTIPSPNFRHLASLAGAGALAMLAACTTPVGPVEVTRFHDGTALAQAGTGVVIVNGSSAGLMNMANEEPYRTAVAAELERIGYRPAGAEGPPADALRAMVSVERQNWQPGRDRSPVSVGVGGSTGTYGSGVGVGVGVDLSGPPPEMNATTLFVRLEDAQGTALWEGRAQFAVRADAPSAQPQLNAAKLAAALFEDFPGNSGETIEVQ